MSQIINLIPNLQEIFNFIKKINDSIKNNEFRLEAEPNEIFDAIESFNREKSNNIERIRSNKDNIESLKMKIFQLNQDIPKLESEISDFTKKQEIIQKDIESKKKDLEEIETEKLNLIGILNKNKENLEDIENELNGSRKKLEEIIQETSKVGERINQEIDALKDGYNKILIKKEEELNNNLNEIKTLNEEKYIILENDFKPIKVKVKALSLLIKHGMLNSELFRFISALEKEKPVELIFICQALKFDSQKADKIIKDMIAKGGPLNFNEKNGLITLEKEVEFKK